MAEHKQYVNLVPGNANELKEIDVARAGRVVQLVAKLNMPVEGVPIVFELKSGSDNVESALDEANFSKAEQRRLAQQRNNLPGFTNPGVARRRVISDANGEARISFHLSNYGGDEFEVEAYIKKRSGGRTRAILSDKYVTWRRIYHQVSRFKAGPRGKGRSGGALPAVGAFPWGPVETEYEARRHNIELIDETGTDLITRRANVIWDDKDLKASAKEGYDATREPLCLRVVLVNLIAEPVTESKQVSGADGKRPIVVRTRRPLWFDESLPLNEDFVVSAEWRIDGSRQPFQRLDPKHARLRATTQVEFDVSQLLPPGSGPTPRVSLNVELRVLETSINGLSWANTIWIAHENMHIGARSDFDKQSTTIHETGHFIDVPPASQSSAYTGHGHTGTHCNTGLSTAQKARSSYSGMPGKCVMFGESAAGRPNRFCQECDPSVRKVPIRLVPMPSSW